MKKITEDDIENLAIELLKEQGFQHFFGPDVAPDGVQPLRANYGEVLLSDKLQEDRLGVRVTVFSGLPYPCKRNIKKIKGIKDRSGVRVTVLRTALP